jgi:hypothetical protein
VTTPLAGAQATISTSTATTDAAGTYSLAIDVATVNTSALLVVTVAKPSYRTCVGTANLVAHTVSGCDVLTLASAEELFPAPADSNLVRLGDGEFTNGTSNSQLQLKQPYGRSKTIELGWPVNFTLASYLNFGVMTSMRGVQATICANTVTVLQGATADTAVALKVFSATNNNLPNSDPDGAFSPYVMEVPTWAIDPVGGKLFVKLDSGDCVNGTAGDPADDFEFVGLYGKFYN